jgi:hypothetical protein
MKHERSGVYTEDSSRTKGTLMKTTTFSQSRTGHRPLWFVPLAAMSLLAAMSIPAYAKDDAGKPAKAASQTAPDVTLPYTFKCPHCSMKITIKTPADWNKDCLTCACGVSNLGCYNETKKNKDKDKGKDKNKDKAKKTESPVVSPKGASL